ncbi:aECM cysteine-cradle domain-containing protein [Caenorhabditis elegans]|uniref:AECM cysteine-cradle domain-containing protein n=1 Tax=Caenorhabditis elegans TaxID=6239 RepID=Q19281_CAEEL|nr:Secreted protein [Caenorhabditis elegans]CCD69098.1 Secreted protein [Caenorhabditis elegans]|eukprot:NP_508698.1 Uncharacterized protein CELE_F09F9.2 [Caenorhabditis elegans]
MKLVVVLACLVVVAEAYSKSGNPYKTKKYKCVEVSDDEEIRIVPKKKPVTSKYPWKTEEEKINRKNEDFRSTESIEMPMAKKVKTQKISTTTPPTVSDVQRDSKGRPLILDPKHCKQVEHYSKTYGVKDVPAWVASNCAFAKMYLPGATCEEINILVASCYKNRS